MRYFTLLPNLGYVRGDPYITFAERGGVKKLDQNANAVREVA